ncbi:acyl-CoA dehydrogenase family protein [Deinococcus arenicola]|uniref:Acyl-CoA/acyl-ACP dehydrogenase n=1 Tax=Deinococcus arenicola TaxID=2994950 RepID=A0ABU4DM78_9DEIO|nr:acyl-CoA dehydrogenase family protein [Deinococcus sp. ZS9-10]MDV6373536.1 acyl-CoA/acyl-ACP dehydrogenase [Deinococcus sp. ZS9-10]
MSSSRPPAELTTAQAEVVDRAAAAIRQHAAECEAAQDVTPGAAQALSDSDYTRLTVPEDRGGLGSNLSQFAQAQLTVGAADAGLALILAMHGHVTGAAFQGQTLPEPLLNAVAQAGERGELLNALASEPELGSPSRGGLPQTRAVPEGFEGGGWRITGRKTWSTGVRALRWALVTAATPDGQVGRYWVDLHGPGIRIEETWQGALALRGSGSHDVVFTDAPATLHAPPAPGQPASSAWFWTAIAATYLGVGFAALDAITVYARQRVPTALGAPIATLPRIQENVGRIATALHAARALLLDAAAQWDADPSAASVPSIGAAKAHAANAAVFATDLASRTAGGASLSAALPLEKLLRDARAGLTHPPTDDTAYTALGRGLLGE